MFVRECRVAAGKRARKDEDFEPKKSCAKKEKIAIKHLAVSQLVSIFAQFLVRYYARF